MEKAILFLIEVLTLVSLSLSGRSRRQGYLPLWTLVAYGLIVSGGVRLRKVEGVDLG